jgi:hypothetical protein
VLLKSDLDLFLIRGAKELEIEGVIGKENVRLVIYVKTGKCPIRSLEDEMQNCQWLKPCWSHKLRTESTPDGLLSDASFGGMAMDNITE